jgi:P-type conjugative transfer protein TrbJ
MRKLSMTRLKSHALPAMIAIALSAAAVAPAGAQLVVYDPTNYASNVLQASRALAQVNNQIRGLSNEATMLIGMAKHLQKLDLNELAKLNGDIAAISELMAEAKGIAFTIEKTKAAFKDQYPTAYAHVKSSGLATEALTRWQSSMDAFEQTLLVQAKVNESLTDDAATLSDLVSASQGAEGSLAAQQAANQLVALNTKQQMQIATLLAAQARAEALDLARKAQGEAAAKAMTKAFIGTGSAYTAK